MFNFRLKIILIILISTNIFLGCSSIPRKRFLIGGTLGGITGATAGTLLSPNSESRGLNALVFGLVGIVAGGVLGLLIHDDSEVPEVKNTQQNALHPELKTQEFSISHSDQKLPAFVRERIKPAVVEELYEQDTISDDGSLHEPHKVYRIKRQAELISKPIKGESK